MPWRPLVATDRAESGFPLSHAQERLWFLWRLEPASDAYNIAVAQRLGNDKPDEALKWLELNTEFNPKSSRTYLLMSQIYGRKNDKENQIKSLEKAVELDPQNQQAARMLEQIKK